MSHDDSVLVFETLDVRRVRNAHSKPNGD